MKFPAPSTTARTTGVAVTAAAALGAGALTAVSVLGTAAAGPGSPVALSGAVYSHDNAPVQVTAAIWPNQKQLDKLPVGSPVPTIEVPVAVAGNQYTVRLDPADVPATHRARTGVDVEVTAHRAGTLDTYTESLTEASTGGWEHAAIVGDQARRAGAVRVGARAADLATALDGPGVLYLRPGGAAAARTARVTAPRVSAAAPDSLQSCPRKWFKTDTTWERRVKVSDVMPEVPYMKGKVIFKNGSEKSLEVAVNLSGTVSGGGTLSREASEKISGAAFKKDRTAKTDWKFRKYYHGCAEHYVQARAERHEGGYYKPQRSRPSYTKCKRYGAVDAWTDAEGKAWTYAAGFKLWGSGFDTQTGYDTMTELVYQFPKKRRWLCGNNDVPAHAELIAGYARKQ